MASLFRERAIFWKFAGRQWFAGVTYGPWCRERLDRRLHLLDGTSAVSGSDKGRFWKDLSESHPVDANQWSVGSVAP